MGSTLVRFNAFKTARVRIDRQCRVIMQNGFFSDSITLREEVLPRVGSEATLGHLRQVAGKLGVDFRAKDMVVKCLHDQRYDAEVNVRVKSAQAVLKRLISEHPEDVSLVEIETRDGKRSGYYA